MFSSSFGQSYALLQNGLPAAGLLAKMICYVCIVLIYKYKYILVFDLNSIPSLVFSYGI